MSASHFGTTYWLDDYWGSYFQQEGEGGVIIGTLAGSAAGVATVTGALQQPVTESGAIQSGAHGHKRRGRELQRFLDEQLVAAEPKRVKAKTPKPKIVKEVEQQPVAVITVPVEYDEEEEIMLLLLAA